jgi:hypothetical protein
MFTILPVVVLLNSGLGNGFPYFLWRTLWAFDIDFNTINRQSNSFSQGI